MSGHPDKEERINFSCAVISYEPESKHHVKLLPALFL